MEKIKSDKDRYSRILQVKEVDENLIEKIKDKKIALIGCGGVGSVLGELLARGGFENLILIDFDIIDQSNLSRQIFFEKNLGENKSKALKRILLNINLNCNIKTYNSELTEKNIDKLLKNVDFVIDGTDNFETRNLINNWCIKNQKDWLYNGAISIESISCIFYHQNNLFEKVFKNFLRNEKATEFGILPSTTFITASIGYIQIIKYFSDIKENKLIKINSWNNTIHEINLK